MASQEVRGRFVWYDLNTTDPDAAVGFYRKVVGWGTTQWKDAPEGMPPYTMWTVGGSSIGGVMELPQQARDAGAPPHWLPYVGTPDTDNTAARAEQLGGRILYPPTDIPTVGRFAVLADPFGAVFAIFTPGTGEQPTVDSSTPGQFSWHELMTTDYQKAYEFYKDLFGWEVTEDMDMGPAGKYRMYGQNGVPYGGMMNLTPDMPMPPAWNLYIRVNDVNATVEKVNQGGGKLLHGPMEVPGGDWIAQFMDPQGAMFAVHQAKKE